MRVNNFIFVTSAERNEIALGSIAGVNEGSVSACIATNIEMNGQSTGTVKGGIVGINKNGGKVTRCRVKAFNGELSGYSNNNASFGGIVGINGADSTISSCTAININCSKGGWKVAGICGSNDGTVTDCATEGTLNLAHSSYVGSIIAFNQGTASDNYDDTGSSYRHYGWPN